MSRVEGGVGIANPDHMPILSCLVPHRVLISGVLPPKACTCPWVRRGLALDVLSVSND